MGARPVLSLQDARRVVTTVLDGERVGAAAVSVTFLSGARMRGLNRRALGHDRLTDVIAFPLAHGGAPAGDVYVCPDAARRAARALDIPEREELIRLIVHGTLHVLGLDHAPGRERTRGPMWRRQERYVRRVLETA